MLLKRNFKRILHISLSLFFLFAYKTSNFKKSSISATLCLHLQRQRLINNRTYTNGESEVAIKIPIKHVMENGTGPSNSAERGVNGMRRDEDVAEAGNENENEDNENNENDEEEEEDDDDDHGGPYTPFDLPSKKLLCLCGVCLDMLESIADACRGRSVSESLSFHQLSLCSEAPGHM